MHVYCYNSTLSSVLTQVSQPVSKLLFSLLLPVAETAEKNKAATQAKRRIYFPGGTSAASQWVQGKKTERLLLCGIVDSTISEGRYLLISLHGP